MYTTQPGQSLIASWSLLARDVIEQFGSRFGGSTNDETSRRLILSESNLRPLGKKKALYISFLAQFKSPLIILMLIGSSVTYFLGQYIDAAIVTGFLLLSVFLGLLHEKLASREINKVLATVPISMQVMRDQESLDISFEEVVPEDVCIFEAENTVPAECLSLKSENFFMNEIVLAGRENPMRLNLSH